MPITTEQINSHIGHIVRTYRESTGISLRECARMTGISHPALSRIETGKQGATAVQLLCIAEAIAMPLSALSLARTTTDDDRARVLIVETGIRCADLALTIRTVGKQITERATQIMALESRSSEAYKIRPTLEVALSTVDDANKAARILEQASREMKP